MSPNNGILFNGVLRPKLLNNPFASCFFINRDFLLPHTPHFDEKNCLPFLVFNIFYLKFPHFQQHVNMFYNELPHD